MLLTIFLVGGVIYITACKFEGKQESKELDKLKKTNEFIKKMLDDKIM